VARGRQAPRRDFFTARISRSLPRVGNAVRGNNEAVEFMVNPFTFLQEVRAEAKKVTWPTRRETMITTGLVVVMVLFASLFFVLVDSALRFLVGLMLRAGQ
jgi:preprotein translocase subunit SecE